MLKIAIIIGSTRPGRKGETVARWVQDIALMRGDAEFELVDIQAFDLPLLDEPKPPAMQDYSHSHTKVWSATIDACDAFVFVTPEYNHSVPAALKNAIDFLYTEWNNKAAGFVSYGGAGGTRSVEQLRQVMAEIKIADVQAQVALTLADDFENYQTLKPRDKHERALNTMLDQVIAWGGALASLRQR
jgi:NAD(P)H-dependent FMN reductase